MSIWRVVTRNEDGAEGYTSHTTLQAAVWQALNTDWRDGIFLRLECPDGAILVREDFRRLEQS
jgi:hypothetical protein